MAYLEDLSGLFSAIAVESEFSLLDNSDDRDALVMTDQGVETIKTPRVRVPFVDASDLNRRIERMLLEAANQSARKVPARAALLEMSEALFLRDLLDEKCFVPYAIAGSRKALDRIDRIGDVKMFLLKTVPDSIVFALAEPEFLGQTAQVWNFANRIQAIAGPSRIAVCLHNRQAIVKFELDDNAPSSALPLSVRIQRRRYVHTFYQELYKLKLPYKETLAKYRAFVAELESNLV